MTDRHEPKALDDFEFAAIVLAHIAANPPTPPNRGMWWEVVPRWRARREYRQDMESWADSCMIMANDLLEVEQALGVARRRDLLREAIE